MTNGAESMKIIYPLRYKYALMTCQVTECTSIFYLTWCKIILNDNNTTTTVNDNNNNNNINNNNNKTT